MRYIHLLAASAVVSAALIFAASRAGAQQQHMVGGVPRNNFTGHSNSSLGSNMPPACRNGCFSWERGHGFRRGFGSVWVVEREVEVPVYVEVPVAAPPPPAAANSGTPNRDVPELPKRKPYVIGASYDSLPGSCMKLIEEGVSYYYCSGEWYREVRAGREPLYRAVARKL